MFFKELNGTDISYDLSVKIKNVVIQFVVFVQSFVQINWTLVAESFKEIPKMKHFLKLQLKLQSKLK